MFTPPFPINSALGPTIRSDTHRVARKVSIAPRRSRAEEHDGLQSDYFVEENRAGSRWPPRYEHELHEQATRARIAQETWFQDVTRDGSLREAQQRDALRFARQEREKLIEQEREDHRRAWEQYHAQKRARFEEIEEQRRRAVEEAERLRRERQRECAVCLDINDMGIMVEVPCRHWYCRIHLQDAFEVAYWSKRPFKCCDQEAPVNLLSDMLSADFQARYSLLVLELSTPNPIYCSNRICGVFLPPTNAVGPDLIECLSCDNATCRHCRNWSHPGTECWADTATQEARALAARVGWKACPNCSNMVERSSGCVHMTCRCGQQFCYRCGRPWSVCGSSCHE